MSLIFTTTEDEKIEDLQSQMDMALRMNEHDLAKDYRSDIQDITEAAIVRAQWCMMGFMANMKGNLPAALTVQAI